MKHLQWAVLSAALLLGVGNPAAVILPLPYHAQEQSNWCWAGSSNMILEYFGETPTQSEIAAFGTGGVNTWNYDWTGPSGDWNSDAGITVYGIDQILEHWNVSQKHGSYTYTETEAEDVLNTGNPFVLRWGWDNGGGHFVVCTGVENGMVHINDPWFSGGVIVSTYDWAARGESYDNGSLHTWTSTVETTMPDPHTAIAASAVQGNTVGLRMAGTMLVCTGYPEGSCVQLFAMNGREMLNRAIGETGRVAVSNMPAGVYTARITGSSGIKTTRIVIGH